MRSSTPSFTLELELDLTRPGERFWEKRVHAAISVYNDCLGQCVRRLHKLRHDRTYQALLRQYAEAKKAGCPVKDISAALAARRQYFGFTEYDMHAYVCSAKHHFGTLGIDECQKLATRAFRAVEKMLYGKASRVRFVSRHEDFSIEGKSSRSALVFRKDTRTVRFGKGHEFRIRYPRSAKAKAYADEALENRVKYCRVLCRTIRGRRRWFVQAVLEGVPPARHAAGPDRPVGLDEGVSTLAVSSGPCVRLFELAPEAEPEEREIRRIRRAMDRSRRSTNPDEYAPDGTILKKKHHWAKSRRYRRLQGRLRETYRGFPLLEPADFSRAEQSGQGGDFMLIENLSEEERRQLVKELQDAGYVQKPFLRQKDVFVTREQFAGLKIGYNDCAKFIFGIADLCTDNFYHKKNARGVTYTYKNRGVPEEKSEAYAKVCNDLMAVVVKYASRQEDRKKNAAK